MYRKIEHAAYATGSQIVEFFRADINNLGRVKTIGMFCDSRAGWTDRLDISHMIVCCENLVRAGALIELSSGENIFQRAYAAFNYNEAAAEYGEYDYLAEGFYEIVKRLGGSVLPIVVQKLSGDHDLGSAFLLGNANTVLTARHVVENMSSLRVLGPDGSDVEIFDIFVSKNKDIDIAILLVRLVESKEIIPLKVANSEILSEVICIGYPPIPGFDAIRIYDKAEINSHLRLSKGRVVSEATSYLDGQDFVLFNARVKGGNSGGPIINARGHVAGMLVQIPIDVKDSQKIDELGYGIAVPHSSILEALKYPESGEKLPLRQIDGYEYSTLC